MNALLNILPPELGSLVEWYVRGVVLCAVAGFCYRWLDRHGMNSRREYYDPTYQSRHYPYYGPFSIGQFYGFLLSSFVTPLCVFVIQPLADRLGVDAAAVVFAAWLLLAGFLLPHLVANRIDRYE